MKKKNAERVKKEVSSSKRCKDSQLLLNFSRNGTTICRGGASPNYKVAN